MVQSQHGQIVRKTLSQKYPTQNRADGAAQAVECLPSKYKILSSNPSTANKKQNQKRSITTPTSLLYPQCFYLRNPHSLSSIKLRKGSAS
jgi:hypothetical protein